MEIIKKEHFVILSTINLPQRIDGAKKKSGGNDAEKMHFRNFKY